MKVIIFTGDNRSANVLTPVYPDQPITEQEETQLLERIQASDVPRYPDGTVRPSFIKDADSEEILQMGTFFGSWKIDEAGTPVWDQYSAQMTKLNELRALRKPILERLDVQFIRALENGDTAELAAITARKKVLRDVTLIDFSQFTTPQSLSQFIPVALLEN
jgi:hypothetical protein